MTSNRIIGFTNRLPWHFPQDLRHFRKLTIHRPIVMGRKTFEAIGRPLPDRKNIVITRRQDFSVAGVERAGSLTDALKMCDPGTRACVIGGGEIFREALPIADRIHLTVIYLLEHQDSLFGPFLGDKFFPSISPREWQIERLGPRRRAKNKSSESRKGSTHGYMNNVFFRFIDMIRVARPSSRPSVESEDDFHWSKYKGFKGRRNPRLGKSRELEWDPR